MINQKIYIPSSITIKIKRKKEKTIIFFKNENGLLALVLHKKLGVFWEKKNRELFLIIDLKNRSVLYLSCNCISDLKQGLIKGVNKKIFFEGRGLKYKNINNCLYFSLGLSHIITLKINKPIKASKIAKNQLVLSSLTKQNLNNFSKNLQKFKIPDSYKGKGIVLENQKLILKEGKKKMY